MKTWGLHRKSSLHTWGLRGKITQIITDGWKDAIRFTVFIKKTLRNLVEL